MELSPISPEDLAIVPLFQGTDEETREAVAHRSRAVTLDAGERLAPTGAGDTSWLLLDGAVQLLLADSEGREAAIPLREGERLWLEPPQTGSFATRLAALEPSRLLRLQTGQLLRLAARNSALANELALAGARAGSAAEERLASFMQSTALQRLAMVLLELVPSGTDALPNLSHRDLSAMIGTSREMVSCLFQRLRRTGVISTQRRTTRVLRRDALESLAARS